MGQMMGMVGQIGQLASSFGGGKEQINFDAMPYAQQANDMLDEALSRALPYSEGWTEAAADQIKRANQLATDQREAGFQRQQGLTAPYRAAGYMALDDYMDTLTLARPEMGSLKLATALESAAKREGALGELNNAVDNVRDYQNLNIAAPVRDPVTGQMMYMPGVYAENMARMGTDMLNGNWFPSASTSAGYVPLNSLTGGYLPLEYQRRYGGMGGSLPGASGNEYGGNIGPMSAQEQTQSTVRDLNSALSNFYRDTQYYTPEHGRIAASFNKGLFGDARWVNVGSSPTQSLLSMYGQG